MIVILSIIAFLLGAIMASFFGVIIYRVPKNESIMFPASHCGDCNHKLAWYDNIPIISYIILRGKCRYCKSKIGLFSFIYEVICAITLTLVVIRLGVNYSTIFYSLLTLILLFIAGYDYKTYEMLDISLIILGVLSIGTFFFNIFYLKENYLNYLLAGIIGFVVFGLIKIVSKVLFKKDALGGGDVILIGFAGLFLGLFNLLFAILVGTFVGCVIELTLMALKLKSKDSLIPFGPYLVLGIIISMLSGDYIYSWILGMVG